MPTTTTTTQDAVAAKVKNIKGNAWLMYQLVENQGLTVKAATEQVGLKGGAGSAALKVARDAVASGEPFTVDGQTPDGSDIALGAGRTFTKADALKLASDIHILGPQFLEMRDRVASETERLAREVKRMEQRIEQLHGEQDAVAGKVHEVEVAAKAAGFDFNDYAARVQEAEDAAAAAATEQDA